MHSLSPDNPLPKELGFLEDHVRSVINGSCVAICASGAPGIGKTHTVLKVLKENGIKPYIENEDGESVDTTKTYAFVKSAKAPGFTKELYRFRKGGIILLDDADELVFSDTEAQANLVKSAFVNKPVREIVRNTARTDMPNRFETRARIIWLTNKNIANPVRMSRSVVEHIQAIRDRLMAEINFTSDRNHILDYVLYLATFGNFLHYQTPARKAMPLAVQNDAIRFFVENAPRLKSISVRQLEKIAVCRSEHPNKWREMLVSELSSVADQTIVIPPVPVLTPGWQKAVA